MTKLAAEDVGARGTMNPERAAKGAAKKIGISADEYLAHRAAGEKWCFRCKAWHPLVSFYRDRSRSDGLTNICRKCARLQNLKFNASVKAVNPRRYWTGGRPAHSQFEDIWRLQQEGLTMPEVARELGCSYQSVRRTVKRARSPVEYRQEALERLASLKQLPTMVRLDRCLPSGDTVGGLFVGVSIEDELQRDAAERLRVIVGDMEPEDVRLLDSNTLARLQDRLRDEGLVPRGVQQIERERLRSPVAHSGAGVDKAPLIPGRKKRAQRVAHKAANRARGNSNRPSQKPRKRWSRDEDISA